MPRSVPQPTRRTLLAGVAAGAGAAALEIPSAATAVSPAGEAAQIARMRSLIDTALAAIERHNAFCGTDDEVEPIAEHALACEAAVDEAVDVIACRGARTHADLICLALAFRLYSRPTLIDGDEDWNCTDHAPAQQALEALVLSILRLES